MNRLLKFFAGFAAASSLMLCGSGFGRATGGPYSSSSASGSNAFAMLTGARFQLDSSAAHYLSSDGTTLSVTGLIFSVPGSNFFVSGNGVSAPAFSSISASFATLLKSVRTNGNVAHQIYTTVDMTSSYLVEFLDNTSTRLSTINWQGFYTMPTQTVTVANDGNAGTAPASTITPSSDNIKLAYNDPTAASVGSLTETGAEEGSTINVLHTGTGGTVVFTEIAAQQEIGGTPCTLATNGILKAIYLNAQWNITECRQN